MLKKIPTRSAQLGMYIQSMEGPWLAHPFWKTKFVLSESADLDALLRISASRSADSFRTNLVFQNGWASQGPSIDWMYMPSWAERVGIFFSTGASIARAAEAAR